MKQNNETHGRSVRAQAAERRLWAMLARFTTDAEAARYRAEDLRRWRDAE